LYLFREFIRLFFFFFFILPAVRTLWLARVSKTSHGVSLLSIASHCRWWKKCQNPEWRDPKLHGSDGWKKDRHRRIHTDRKWKYTHRHTICTRSLAIYIYYIVCGNNMYRNITANTFKSANCIGFFFTVLCFYEQELRNEFRRWAITLKNLNRITIPSAP